MKSLKTSFLLLLPTIFGVAGLHRFYMGKIPTGILWLLTWGLGGVGTIYDAVTMAKQLSKADEEATGQRIDPSEYWIELAESMPDRSMRQRIENKYGYTASRQPDRASPRADSLEFTALRLARDSGGLVSPAQLALEAHVSSDESKKELENLVNKGIAEIRIRRNGVVVYSFPEFLSPDKAMDLESF